MTNTYEGDHFDLSDSVFHDSVTGKVEHHYHPGPVRTAVAPMPAAPLVFTGREDDLSRLLPLIDPASDAELPALICAVSGLGGIGKTSLALHVAHRAAQNGWFPGGTLFIDLRGYDDNPVTTDQAVLTLLEVLGMRDTDLPATTDAKCSLYRSLLAEQSEPLLLVLDNASHQDQVLPLLPGVRRHRVLVTSRHTLPTLGARLIDLKILNAEAALELLRQALRTADPADRRVAEAGESAAEVARLCGYLPLALHIVAALLVLEPEQSVAEVASALAQARSSLDYLDDGDRAVRASFDLSYRHLTDEQADLLRLLAFSPGPDISLAGVAALAGQPPGVVGTTLRELVRAHLVERSGGRWTMHDLVRDYAGEQAAAVTAAGAEPGQGHGERPAESYRKAQTRLLEYYFATAGAADDHLSGPRGPLPTGTFATRDEALAWLDAERSNLTAAVTAASVTGHQHIAIGFPIRLYAYLTRRRYFDDLIAVTTIAVETARLTGDKSGEAKASNNLGIALTEVDRYEDAFVSFIRAAELFTDLDDQSELGRVLNSHGLALREVGRPAEALPKFRAAMTLQQHAGDLREQATLLNNISLVHQDLEDHAEATAAAEGAASLFQQLGDAVHEATALGTMAWTLHAQGRTHEALTACERALETISSLDEPDQQGTLLLIRAELSKSVAPERATTYYQQAVAAYVRAENPALQAQARVAMAMALIESGQRLSAFDPLREAIQIYTDLGFDDEATRTQTLLGLIGP
ncbi:ATP-binding protein [Streptomyces sp. TRM68416]|uniref:ATP-binding protein n=1 Tax=Streptomyces sp. TRM68416 TaxID=2758412 RepID=UPI001661D46E|nr:tetratricopeptide repeat protein [Streptomyces sp. TRM68416]MBD0838208.1 tetratricopeptide repeat protein [Streptomyces sp. TRM68416]